MSLKCLCLWGTIIHNLLTYLLTVVRAPAAVQWCRCSYNKCSEMKWPAVRGDCAAVSVEWFRRPQIVSTPCVLCLCWSRRDVRCSSVARWALCSPANARCCCWGWRMTSCLGRDHKRRCVHRRRPLHQTNSPPPSPTTTHTSNTDTVTLIIVEGDLSDTYTTADQIRV